MQGPVSLLVPIANQGEPMDLRPDPIMQEDSTDAQVYIYQRAESYLPADYAFSTINCPDWTDRTAEPDRPASRLTSPNATDESVKLAQYVRASGLRGVAVLSAHECDPHRHLTARGTGTRPFPFDTRGLCPTERLNWSPVSEDEALSEGEHRQLRRYRDAMKGAKFAASMAAERKARADGVRRNLLFPYYPWDAKNARVVYGVPCSNLATRKPDRYFPDGTFRSERYETYLKYWGEDVESAESNQSRELARLIAEQEADARAQRKGLALV